MDTLELTTIESWKLSHAKEVIADLQHSLTGLMPGKLLESSKTGLTWKVLFRVIFTQVENQKRFEGEEERTIHISLDAPKASNLEKFQESITVYERQNIYQYVLEPQGHSAKPQKGEVLKIKR